MQIFVHRTIDSSDYNHMKSEMKLLDLAQITTIFTNCESNHSLNHTEFIRATRTHKSVCNKTDHQAQRNLKKTRFFEENFEPNTSLIYYQTLTHQ